MRPSAKATPGGAQAGGGPVLLFDGECGLCNRIVRLMLCLDRRGELRFAALQGPSAQDFLRVQGLPVEDFDTLIFVPDWARRECPGYLVRTDGALAALAACGGVGRWLAGLRIVPASWRDACYKGVARVRYRMMGTWRPRPLARPEWEQRFFD